jgi:hypothetical protein
VVGKILSHNASLILVPIFGIVIYATRIHKNGKTSALSCADWLAWLSLSFAFFVHWFLSKLIIRIVHHREWWRWWWLTYLTECLRYTSCNSEGTKSMGKHFLDLSHPLFSHQPLLLLFFLSHSLAFYSPWITSELCVAFFLPQRGSSRGDMKEGDEGGRMWSVTVYLL